MAKFYGGSNYLRNKNLKYFMWSGVIIFVPLIVVLFLSRISRPGWTIVIVIVSILIIIRMLESLSNLLLKRSSQYFRGDSGEYAIKKELGKLSEDYTIVCDVNIGVNKGNIDFVVIGPTGIFALEVKSHTGNIDFNGYDFTRNGRRFSGNGIARQVHGQSFALRNYLKKKTGKDLFVTSVLVFSNKYAKMRFGYKPVANIIVVQKNFLLDVFGRSSRYNFPINKEIIVQALIKEKVSGAI